MLVRYSTKLSFINPYNGDIMEQQTFLPEKKIITRKKVKGSEIIDMLLDIFAAVQRIERRMAGDNYQESPPPRQKEKRAAIYAL